MELGSSFWIYTSAIALLIFGVLSVRVWMQSRKTPMYYPVLPGLVACNLALLSVSFLLLNVFWNPPADLENTSFPLAMTLTVCPLLLCLAIGCSAQHYRCVCRRIDKFNERMQAET